MEVNNMIHFEIKGDLDFADKLFEALVGSPAYVKSEIVLNNDRAGTIGIIDLYVGNNNNNDITVRVEPSTLIRGGGFIK